MGDEVYDSQNTQTQTQNSQVEWSQPNTPSFIPNIWGRLYSTKLSIVGKHCWTNNNSNNPEYYDLIQPEFTLGRALTSTFIMKKDIIKEDIIKNVSKHHFTIKRDLSEPPSPSIITDLSYNGTFVNGIKIGKGNSRVLDDNDVISVTHAAVKMFLFKDLLKSEQDKVPKEISQKYYISKTLGQGACGVVKLVYHKPCIVSTQEVFDCSESVYIVLELMQGGELFDRIIRLGRLPERQTRLLFRQMVLGVKYLHTRGITHRDLKPENVLLESKEDETRVKISDFGLSKFVGEDSFMKTMCGTPMYLAPEVLRAEGTRSYGPEVDVWSLGVIFFICLSGYMPFSNDYKELSVVDQILSGQYRYSATHWRGVSGSARQLMRQMLTVDANKRITLQQILDHKWMQDPEVIMRVDMLLAGNKGVCSGDEKDSDEENNNRNIKKDMVTKLAASNKRALSDSFNSCEPIPKKFKVIEYTGINNSNDTGSTNSCCSEE